MYGLFIKLCDKIFNPVLAYRGVYSADYHNDNGRTAYCWKYENTHYFPVLPNRIILMRQRIMLRLREDKMMWLLAAPAPQH
jgi:hypothetical protein